MDSILYNKRLQSPVYTGVPVEIQKNQTAGKTSGEQESFHDLLAQKVQEESSVEFSKHAMERVIQRNVDVSAESMERLNEGVRLAEEKGLQDPLILVGSTAYVVNMRNNRVVTVVSDENLKGKIFTNIDGTVMI